MSRIGKLPVAIPETVKASVEGQTVSVEGPKGKLRQTFNSQVAIEMADGEIRFAPRGKTRFANAMYGTARSIVAGMVEGVVNGFSKDLEISGVGFQASVQGQVVALKLGFSHEIRHAIPEGVAVSAESGGAKLKVQGVDKQAVGQVAAAIKRYYPAEPYKGKGVRIVGEPVRRKEGKTVA